ncbi:MAG: orotate phosphoribosyltransferase [Hyphomicrobiaceae bacterium]
MTQNHGEDRAKLIALITERSFRDGEEFTLASGRKSTIYFNLKPTMMSADGARLIAAQVLHKIGDRNVDLIGGLEMGAVPLATAVAQASSQTAKVINAFFVRKAAKQHGTQSLVEGLVADDTMAGKKIVVIEDVTTTGGSAIKAAQALREEGAEIISVITIVDRQEGAAEAFTQADLPFEAILTKADFTK